MAVAGGAIGLLRATLLPMPYSSDRWKVFLQHASGERQVDVAWKSLRSAESYIQAGAYEFAVLLCTIAVEVATTRFVHARLQEEGVSKTKLDDLEGDLTFSIMLNTQIVALTPGKSKPDPRLLGKIDRLRRIRNELMHRGQFSLSRQEVVELAKAAELYLRYLEIIKDPTMPI